MPLGVHLPLRFQGKRTRKSLLLLVVALAFVVAGVYLLPSSPLRGYSAIAFFGIGGAVIAVNLLPGSSYLLLEQGGFTVCNVFRKTFYSWSDVAEFLPVEVGTQTMVGLRFNERYKGNATGRKLARYLAGSDGALPDTYGQEVQDLVSLLNKVRAKQAPAVLVH
jgi:hypothetical protein